MKIGIIVYSQTGNTLAVAQKIQTACAAAGHEAEVKQITVQQTPNSNSSCSLVDIPDTAGCDALILGAPVQAFHLCQPMTKYLKQLPDLGGLPVGFYLLQGLPKKWMGGNTAARRLRALCAKKGADAVQIGHIHWRPATMDQQIADTVSAALKFAATAN